MPKETRADLHERFARWLEQRATEDDVLVGYHLEQAVRYRRELRLADEREAGLAREAAELLGRSGALALERGDAPAAAGLLERAVSLLGAGEPERLRLRVALGTALRDAGRIAEAEPILREACDDAVTSGDERLATRARIEHGVLRVLLGKAGSVERLLEEAERAIAVFAEPADEAELARAWRLVALCSTVRWQASAATAALEPALVHARAAGDTRLVRTILAELAAAELLGSKPVEEAIERCDAILAEAAGDHVLAGIVLAVRATLDAMAGRLDEARPAFEQARDILESFGRQVPVAVLCGWHGLVLLQAGRAAAAERELRAALEVLDALGEKSVRASIAAYLADALLAQSRNDDAAQIEALVAADGDGPLAAQAIWCGVRAKLAASRGDVAAAAPLAQRGVELAEATDCLSLRGEVRLSLADVLLSAGRGEDAQAAAGAAVRLFEEKGNVLGAGAAAAVLRRATAAEAPVP